MELHYWQVRLCVFLSTRLPLRLCYFLAERAADVVYVIWPRLREDTKSSIAHILGQAEESREVAVVTRSCLRNYAKYVVELCRYNGRPVNLDNRVSFEGLDRLDAALGEGKGAIIVSLHLGSWDVGAAFLSQHNYPLNAMVRSFAGQDKLGELIEELRRKVGIAAIYAEDGIKRAAEVLRRNELLLLLVDAPVAGRQVKVKFFRDDARFSPGVAALALRTEATILPACTVRLPDNTFRGFIGEKVEYHRGDDFRSDIQHLTQGILDSLQGFVIQYPEQWAMLRRVWRD